MIGLMVMLAGAWMGWKMLPHVWRLYAADAGERGLALAAVLVAGAAGMAVLYKLLTVIFDVIQDFIFHFELFSIATLLVAAMAWLVVWFIRDAFFSKNAKFV